jgi:hypothetical protein
MGAQSTSSSRTNDAYGTDAGSLELTVKRVRDRLRLLENLAAEIAALERSPEAQRRRRISEAADPASAHAAANIAGWRHYLPEDCIGSMIRDGWHWST